MIGLEWGLSCSPTQWKRHKMKYSQYPWLRNQSGQFSKRKGETPESYFYDLFSYYFEFSSVFFVKLSNVVLALCFLLITGVNCLQFDDEYCFLNKICHTGSHLLCLGSDFGRIQSDCAKFIHIFDFSPVSPLRPFEVPTRNQAGRDFTWQHDCIEKWTPGNQVWQTRIGRGGGGGKRSPLLLLN